MDAIDDLLLARTRTVYLDGAARRDDGGETDVVALESDLLAVGLLLSPDLHAALRGLTAEDADAVGHHVLHSVLRHLGAGRPHVPLFRNFPQSTPQDTYRLWVDRVFTWITQEPRQPCVMCARVDTVIPLDPCGHLVCTSCWDGTDYSACPICRRRLAPDSPFLRGMPKGLANLSEKLGATARWRATRRLAKHRGEAGPQPSVEPALLAFTVDKRLALLRLGTDREADARAIATALASRTTPLSPDDAGALRTILATEPTAMLAALPERIPVRETMALAVGGALSGEREAEPAATAAALQAHARTATDVLRVLVVALGGTPDLTATPPAQPRRVSLPRRMRDLLLDHLETCPNLVEDVLRHRELWKRTARGLHPFEKPARRPRVTIAFAVLRGSAYGADSPVGRVLDEADEPRVRVHRADGTVRATFRGWSGEVEAALAAGDVGRATALLEQRPGDLMRRLDHLLRLGGTPDLGGALPRAATPMLFTVAAHLRGRSLNRPRRVFFPKGNVSLTWGRSDDRPLLPADVAFPIADALDAELRRRAAGLPSLGHVLVDPALRDVPIPAGERSASRALHPIPRGARLPLPDGEPLRFFVHWMEDEGQRVDLDLSLCAYSDSWRFKGLCDYTQMRLADTAAVHSGDLTSAPPPLGASEFLDLDLDRLRDVVGARYLVAVVFSYNSVAFEDMREALAGFMAGPRGDEPFDPSAVEQRFDLEGDAKIAVPLLIDIETRTYRWLDVRFTSHATFNAALGFRVALGLLARDLDRAFDTRPTLFDLAMIHASRATTVTVLGEGEDPVAPGDGPWLACVVEDDVDLPPGSTLCALRTHRPHPGVETIAPLDLLAQLG